MALGMALENAPGLAACVCKPRSNANVKPAANGNVMCAKNVAVKKKPTANVAATKIASAVTKTSAAALIANCKCTR